MSFDGATLRSGATVIGNASGFEGVKYYGSSDVFDFDGLSGSDHIELGAANDTAFGNGGADTLLGGAGIDTLGGGAGDDFITSGAGRDIMTGDAGIDLFIYVSKADSTIGASATASPISRPVSTRSISARSPSAFCPGAARVVSQAAGRGRFAMRTGPAQRLLRATSTATGRRVPDRAERFHEPRRHRFRPMNRALDFEIAWVTSR
ncbi:MAG: hypothetical protein H0T75_22070 [Rhizobiales bacterium]|nr:hypothetical protein [Hyphomicrobiales bacterium]